MKVERVEEKESVSVAWACVFGKEAGCKRNSMSLTCEFDMTLFIQENAGRRKHQM